MLSAYIAITSHMTSVTAIKRWSPEARKAKKELEVNSNRRHAQHWIDLGERGRCGRWSTGAELAGGGGGVRNPQPRPGPLKGFVQIQRVFWWEQGGYPPREVLNYSPSHFYLLETGLRLLVRPCFNILSVVWLLSGQEFGSIESYRHRPRIKKTQ